MTVRAADGRALSPADGREYFAALGRMGGRPKRKRLNAPRRLAGRPALPTSISQARHEEEEAPPITSYRFA